MYFFTRTIKHTSIVAQINIKRLIEVNHIFVFLFILQKERQFIINKDDILIVLYVYNK